jgi:hypothetical protein
LRIERNRAAHRLTVIGIDVPRSSLIAPFFQGVPMTTGNAARLVLAASILTMIVSSRGIAQRVDPTRLVAARDSFEVFANGVKRGSWRTVVTREAENVQYVADLTIDERPTEHMEILFDGKTAMPVSYVSTEMSGPEVAKANVSVSPQGQATGTLRIGSWAGKVDMHVVSGSIPDAAFSVLLPTLDLADGFSTTFPSPSYSTQVVTTITFVVTVMGRQKVTVPAGTFDVFQVVLTGIGQPPISAYITTAAPRRTVLIRSGGGAVEMRLVSPKAKRPASQRAKAAPPR